jgi:hypothetical protein
MRRLLAIAILVLVAAVAGCNDGEGSPVQRDRYIKFTSHLGNSFVAPSQWTTEDEGNTFSLKSPDGHAVIHTIIYTSEGSGSLDDFRQTMTTGLLPKNASHWKDSKWTEIKIGEVQASKRDLVPVPATDHEWRLYVVDGGKYYHAIVLNASTTAMALNGEFYENIVRTFEGLRE